jgi:hypothetical protein
MTNQVAMSTSSHVLNFISWLFGLAFFAIGVINTFWGNDPGFGVFIVLLSLVYFPPLTALFKEKTGFAIPRVIKILLGLFILWAALGVGELFDKIDLMMMDL